MSKEEHGNAIYAVAVLCVVAVLIGAVQMMHLSSRVEAVGSNYDKAMEEMNYRYDAIQIERGSDNKACDDRLDAIEKMLGIDEA